jgi:hypothetical protein
MNLLPIVLTCQAQLPTKLGALLSGPAPYMHQYISQ